MEKDGCGGYWIDTIDGRYFDCGYEFAGQGGCEDCIFGPYPGPDSFDPRVNPDKEEEDERIST